MGKQKRNEIILELVAERTLRSSNPTSHLMEDAPHHFLRPLSIVSQQSSSSGEFIIFTSIYRLVLGWNLPLYLLILFLSSRQIEGKSAFPSSTFWISADNYHLYSYNFFSYSLELVVTLIWCFPVCQRLKSGNRIRN